MYDAALIQQEVTEKGYAVINDIYLNDTIAAILTKVQNADNSKTTFRKTDDLFAVRQLLKEIPVLISLVFNDKLKEVINEVFGNEYSVVKSIYFDKPEKSNWFVAWHQDLTISVDKRIELVGFGPWTVKQNQFAVQPPLNILENNFTIRVHLDRANEGNGALRIIPGSHSKGITRLENVDLSGKTETICNVEAGGIMLMKPLLLHASNRTSSNEPRKVIHIEFSKANLPEGIQWSEMQILN
jgi:ectoine hydroxylase-related dioxygenase (phytanoyl-CoA dioxygenase family)